MTEFSNFKLDRSLNRAIETLGFTHCTPIQRELLPYSLQGKDVLGQAQTGTGKTATFLITIIAHLLRQQQLSPQATAQPQALIIAPVRELAIQINRDAQALCRFNDLHCFNIIGGKSLKKQKRQLDSRPVNILTGTPGKLRDFQRQGLLNLRKVKFLVLDEADRMLDMGFIRDVSHLIGALPQKRHRQTQLFSATLNANVRRLADSWLNKPATFEIEPENIATDLVKQTVYLVSSDEKLTVLSNILKQTEVSSALVFVNRRERVHWLADKLQKQGLPCGQLSGSMSQRDRTRNLEKFRTGKLRYIIATDVAGRGLHIDGISHVINFDLPGEPEDYVHRIGRTGRAGQIGHSISLACETGIFQIQPIEELLNTKLESRIPPVEMLEASSGKALPPQTHP